MRPEALALLAAACWAVSSLFSAPPAQRLGAFAFSRWRMLFASLLLWGLALFSGGWRSLDASAMGLLALSGLVGIFIGDTALFACMNRLGPRRSGVLFACHALFSGVLAWVWLGEVLWGWALLGSELLVAGVMLVGLGAGAEFDIAAFLVSRYFGLRDYGRLFGVHLGLITLASTIAPWLFGRLYRSTGNYEAMLMICGPIFLAGGLSLLALGRHPRFFAVTTYLRATP